MKKSSFFILTVLVASLLSECGSDKGKNANGFGAPVELRADSIAIREILQPKSWVAAGDKAIVGSGKGSDSLVYVYSLPEFRCLYAGLRTGGGPGELANPYAELVQKYDRDGRFLLYHFGSGRMYHFTATDTGFAVGDAKELTRGVDKGYSGGELLVDSDIPWDSDPNVKQNVYLYLYDMSTGNTLDSVLSQSVFSPTPGKNYGAFKNGTISLYNGNLCAVVYGNTGRVEYYDISSGKLEFKGAVGDNTPAEKLMEVNFDTWKGPDYREGATDGKYLYVLVNEIRLDSHGKKQIVSSSVLVYDWEGHPVKWIKLDKAVDNILTGTGKIYAYDSDRDFEQVYVFNTGI